MKHIVLCPGSRSAPLAVAAGWLEEQGQITLTTAIDERSASFLALGLSTPSGKAACVVTTSGTAVAELLPAAVEADLSCKPLLLITADRPERLKNCGSNQTVNQEEFLKPVIRGFLQGPRDGLHFLNSKYLTSLIDESWNKAHFFPGPVHLNLAIEEPLHAEQNERTQVFNGWTPLSLKKGKYVELNSKGSSEQKFNEFFPLEPTLPGLILAGPWRGHPSSLNAFKAAVQSWQNLSGWPIFADPLSCIPRDQPGLINHWELLLSLGISFPNKDFQILRLGPIPSSKYLESWLRGSFKKQLLISEGDCRDLDPTGIAFQWSKGFDSWLETFKIKKFSTSDKKSFNEIKSSIISDLLSKDHYVQSFLDDRLKLEGPCNEPCLARWLPRLLPKEINIMLASSSPVRDWLSYSGKEICNRRIFSFRGASGIDGTLSLGFGLSIETGPTILITGDLALLHDSNGWLFANKDGPNLIVFLIDNGGGGIFYQLQNRNLETEQIDKLFSMPQSVDHLALADAYQIPYRQISCLDDLANALEWASFCSGPVLLRVCTNPLKDSLLRDDLRKELSIKIKNMPNNVSNHG